MDNVINGKILSEDILGLYLFDNKQRCVGGQPGSAHYKSNVRKNQVIITR